MSAFSRIKAANTRRQPEESVALRVAVTVAVVAAATATLRQGVGGAPLAVGTVVGIPAAMIFSHVTRHRDGYLLKVLLALGILAAFGQFLIQVAQLRTGVAADVQIPLAELFLWTQLLHSFDVPARRDLQYSLVSSLVLIGVAGVLSISMSYGLHLLVWAGAACVAMVLAHRSEMAELPRLIPSPGAPGRPTGLGRSVRPAVAALVAILVLGGVAFAFVPPAGTARGLAFPSVLPAAPGGLPVPGGLSNPSLGSNDPANNDPGRLDQTAGEGASFGYFGFAEELDTAVRGRPDNTLVMRVRSSRADFWRGQTFDTWDGRRWTLADDRTRNLRSDVLPLEIPATPTEAKFGGNELVQTFYLERPGPNLIFSAYAPHRVYFADRQLFQLPDGTLRAGVDLGGETVYTVISLRPAVTEQILREASDIGGGVPEEITRKYLQLPADLPARVRQLAADVTRSAPTRYDKVRALEAWMGRNTTYTLDIPPLPRGADAVEQYLFVDRQGFCEQIGTSLVVMLRSLGIPARLAVGYASGKRNPFTGMYEVRASDAHSWAEVWFPGLGWQGFDPTAEVPLAGDPGPVSAAAGIGEYLDFSLPALPDRAGEFALVGSAVGAGLGLIAWGISAMVRRRRLARRPWVTQFLDEAERLGRARGRPRAVDQTGPAYLRHLGRTVLAHDRLSGVADSLEGEIFGSTPTTAEQRTEAERVLQEAAARWPEG